MLRREKSLVVVFMVGVLCASIQIVAAAELPFQGKLTDSAGNPIDGQVTVTFRLYDAENAPIVDALWSETWANLSVNKGLFSVVLGSLTPINNQTEPRVGVNEHLFLGIQVQGDPAEMSPRTEIHPNSLGRFEGTIDVRNGPNINMIGTDSIVFLNSKTLSTEKVNVGSMARLDWWNLDNVSGGRLRIWSDNSPSPRIYLDGRGGKIFAVTTALQPIDSRPSDKENLKQVVGALGRISQITGYSYTRQEDKDSGEESLGLLAEEVNEVFPEVISDGPEGMRGISYQELVIPLIEAVKELKAMVDAQGKEIEALKAKGLGKGQ